MGYALLSKLYYQNREQYEETYQARFRSEYAIHVDFAIDGAPSFFLQTPEIISLLTGILRTNRKVSELCHALPRVAIQQFSRRCLIDEIILTNHIEGVRSTRKEIREILEELDDKVQGKRKRMWGLVQKYNTLMQREHLPLETCEDIRSIYDTLVLPEVEEEEPGNRPDGIWFRKGPVSIYSPAQKEIHKGLFPETNIIRGMEQALAFLQDDACEILYRIAIFHYLLEYIHPFYDGNGRLGRFLCSYLLSKELEPVTGYRLSYTIKENIKEYNRAFTLSNDPLNKGDLTPFLVMFLRIVKESVEKLEESLFERLTRLEACFRMIPKLVTDGDETMEELYSLLMQAALFAELGVPTDVVMKHLGISRTTLNRKLEQIPAEFLTKTKRGVTNYYSMDLEQLEGRFPANES